MHIATSIYRLQILCVSFELSICQRNLLAWLEGRHAEIRTRCTAECIAKIALKPKRVSTRQTKTNIHTLPQDEAGSGPVSALLTPLASSSARPQLQFLHALREEPDISQSSPTESQKERSHQKKRTLDRKTSNTRAGAVDASLRSASSRSPSPSSSRRSCV